MNRTLRFALLGLSVSTALVSVAAGAGKTRVASARRAGTATRATSATSVPGAASAKTASTSATDAAEENLDVAVADEAAAGDDPAAGAAARDARADDLTLRTSHPSAASGLKAKGYAELRLRDHLDINEQKEKNRFRFRIRLRGELAYDGFFIGAGVRTRNEGVAGYTSDNFTIDGHGWPVPYLNLAYLGYRQEGPRFSYQVSGGYILNPFQVNPLLKSQESVAGRSVQSIRMFDRDHTPVGAAATAALSAPAGVKLFATASAWSLALQDGRNSDVMLGAQAGLASKHFLLAGAYYDYGTPGGEMAVFAAKEGGNTAAKDAAGKIIGVANPFRIASVTTRTNLEPLIRLPQASLQLEYSRNLAAPAKNNSFYGALTGRVGPVQMLVDAFYVQGDSVFGGYSDSDRFFADAKGFSTAYSFHITKNFFVTANYFGVWKMSGALTGMQHRMFLSFTSRIGG